jgi:hypothetical protein
VCVERQADRKRVTRNRLKERRVKNDQSKPNKNTPPNVTTKMESSTSQPGDTSEIPFDSSPHGELRRLQRRISVRDLQAAVKYGVKEPGYPNPKDGSSRWKFTYMDVVYITDASTKKEVTSYALALPLDEVPLDQRMLNAVREAKKRISSNREIITSHTVFVVDQSASMQKSDVSVHLFCTIL